MRSRWRLATVPLVILLMTPLDSARCQTAAAAVKNRLDMQKRLIAELSGYHLVSGEQSAVDRSSEDQRAWAADIIASRLESIGLKTSRHVYRQRNINGAVDLLFKPYLGTNVIGSLQATVPNAPHVVVGAHYDSVTGSPGAGDNAAGVSVVYAIADTLRHLETRCVNFLFVFFDQEEDDEVGSKAWVRHIREQGIEIHSVHITDLAGWADYPDAPIEIQSPGPYLETIYRTAADTLGLEIQTTSGGSSDNNSFLAHGYRTAGVFGEILKYLHTPDDTVETVDFVYLDSLTSLMLDVLTRIAGGQ